MSWLDGTGPTCKRRRDGVGLTWAVCAGCAVALFCTSGLAVNAFSVYQPYLIAQGGLSGAQSSAIIAVRGLFSMAGMLACAACYRRLSLRAGLFFSLLLLAAGFATFGLAGGFAGYCVAAALVGMAYGLGGMIPVAMLVSRWFEGRRSLALGICSAATGLSTLGIPSLITWAVENLGLPTAFFGEALIVTALAFACLALVRSDPKKLGLEPYGHAEKPAQATRTATGGGLDGLGWAMMIGAMLLLGAVACVGMSHLSVLATSAGIDANGAALAVTVAGVSITAGKLAFGWLADRMGAWRCNWLFGMLAVAGLAGLCLAGGVAPFVASACLYGSGMALAAVGSTVWATDLSDAAGYDRMVRCFQLAYAAGGFALAAMPGALADVTGGSYVPAFALLGVFALLMLAAVQWVYARHARGSSQEGRGSLAVATQPSADVRGAAL